MKILIVYGTSEGQTRKIARFMEQKLQDKKHFVTIADASEEPPPPESFEMVLIGSSIHIQKYHPAVRHYILEQKEVINKLPNAFFSVSMAMASEIKEEHEEAQRIAKDFVVETGLQPKVIWHLAGALRYTKYDYFKKLVMRMIARKEGGSTDTSQDHEYTDWIALEKAINKFMSNYE